MSQLARLTFKNLRRHPLRSFLTACGIMVALVALIMIRTLLDAWYSGVRQSSRDRLIVRNSVSLVFYLPIAYGPRIAQVPGVERVAYANWFGGMYRENRFDFANFAVSDGYVDLYPEFILSEEERLAFKRDRRGALIGEEVAQAFDLKVGSPLRLKGTVYPGDWDFVVRGILKKRDPQVDSLIMFFQWDYLNERIKQMAVRNPGQAGIYVVQLASGANGALVSKKIDALFANSYAETLTENETAFIQSFVSMSSAIIDALNVVSVVVVAIILLVLANTMVMSTREKLREFAMLKALGFEGSKLFWLIAGEGILLSLGGFLLLCLVLPPIFWLFSSKLMSQLATFFPSFTLNLWWLVLAATLCVFLGLLSGVVPYLTVSRMKVAEVLRRSE